jgi:hypothetical protein
MSFEGYWQLLCKNGHCSDYPVTYGGEEAYFKNFTCDHLIEGKPCGAKVEWTNLVDDTNCDAYGYHKMEEQTKAIVKRCDLGFEHVWTEATYKPSKNPYFYDGNVDQWVEILDCKTCGDPCDVLCECKEQQPE